MGREEVEVEVVSVSEAEVVSEVRGAGFRGSGRGGPRGRGGNGASGAGGTASGTRQCNYNPSLCKIKTNSR